MFCILISILFIAVSTGWQETLLQTVDPGRETHLHAEFVGNEDLKLNVHANIFLKCKNSEWN